MYIRKNIQYLTKEWKKNPPVPVITIGLFILMAIGLFGVFGNGNLAQACAIFTLVWLGLLSIALAVSLVNEIVSAIKEFLFEDMEEKSETN